MGITFEKIMIGKRMGGTYWCKTKSSFQSVYRLDDFQTYELARQLLDSTTDSRSQGDFTLK